MMHGRRVVVTGLGLVTSLGEELETFWSGILEGRSGIRRIQRFDPVSTGFPVTIGSECVDFDPGRYIERRESKRMDRFTQFGLAASINAMKDAALDVGSFDAERIGVLIGSGIGGLQEIEEQHVRLMNKGVGQVSAFTVPKLMANAASGNVSIHFGCKGPCSAVATACATGGNAIGDAFRLIQDGEVEAMIAGGAEAALTPLGLGAFCAARALSRRNETPETASRPFDLERDGFVMGEGAGVVVLEELEFARARGARIYAEIIAYGSRADAHHITSPDEQGSGAMRTMARALQNAGLTPDKISYINAHGTSTPVGDRAEVLAVKRLFGDLARTVPVSSTKGHIGHLLGAAGGVEAIITSLAVYHQILPPTINYTTPDPECDLDVVPNTARPAVVDVAMSNNFGFGGHNVSLIFARYRPA